MDAKSVQSECKASHGGTTIPPEHGFPDHSPSPHFQIAFMVPVPVWHKKRYEFLVSFGVCIKA